MKCPHCNYEHSYCSDTKTGIKGKKGDFFWIHGLNNENIAMARSVKGNREYKSIIGCPACNKIFMD
jgi:hypothetical protein